MSNETIGTIEWDGETYEIDWPFDLDDPEQRSDFGAIYHTGRQVGEVAADLGNQFNTKQDVLDAAYDLITNTDLLDEEN